MLDLLMPAVPTCSHNLTSSQLAFYVGDLRIVRCSILVMMPHYLLCKFSIPLNSGRLQYSTLDPRVIVDMYINS